jgi:hypothetical protein
MIEGLDFSSGVIEAELAGAPASDAPVDARGLVGIAVPLAAGSGDLRGV